MNDSDSSESNRTLSKKARIKLDDDASLTDLFDEFEVDEKTQKRVFEALKLAADEKVAPVCNVNTNV